MSRRQIGRGDQPQPREKKGDLEVAFLIVFVGVEPCRWSEGLEKCDQRPRFDIVQVRAGAHRVAAHSTLNQVFERRVFAVVKVWRRALQAVQHGGLKRADVALVGAAGDVVAAVVGEVCATVAGDAARLIALKNDLAEGFFVGGREPRRRR